MKIIIATFLALSALVCDHAHAQYASLTQNAASAAEIEQATLLEVREKMAGVKFWIEPNGSAINRKEFISAEEDGSIGSEKFVVTKETSFSVVGFASRGYRNYVKIIFPDGKIAYLEEAIVFKSNPKKYALFDDLYVIGKPKHNFIEYILPVSPEEVRLAEKKSKVKAANAAAAWKARGGVRIGMTAKQVRASNWGGPESINRSTGSYGTHEQWVYGGGNYIYFENGVVSSIQN